MSIALRRYFFGWTAQLIFSFLCSLLSTLCIVASFVAAIQENQYYEYVYWVPMHCCIASCAITSVSAMNTKNVFENCPSVYTWHRQPDTIVMWLLIWQEKTHGTKDKSMHHSAHRCPSYRPHKNTVLVVVPRILDCAVEVPSLRMRCCSSINCGSPP